MNSEKNNIIHNINKFCQFILDVIFPKYCVGCQKEGEWICGNCKKEIVIIKKPTCPRCKRLTNSGQFCRRCKDKSSLTGLMVAAYYSEGPLKEAIHNFKYNGAFDLKKDLAEIFVEVLKNNSQKNIILVPVPLHKRRKAERGYNQSELLAKAISEKLRYELIKNKLIRTKYTEPQVKLSGKKRHQNIENVFKWTGKNIISNKTIFIIDDVYTTGATLEECAKTLRLHGAKKIWGLVLAKV